MAKYIITIICTLLCVYAIVNQIRYSQLEEEYLILKFNNTHLLDSLVNENNILNVKIIKLDESLHNYTEQIDSLKTLKQIIIINEFKESINLSESVKVLKQNLQCEKY